MNRLELKVKYNIVNIVVVLVLSSIAFFVHFTKFIDETTGYHANMLDFFFYIYNDYSATVYLLPVLYLFLISFILRKSSFNVYKLIRFPSKKLWYKHNVFLIIQYSFFYLIMINSIFFLLSILNYPLEFQWSDFATNENYYYFSSHTSFLLAFLFQQLGLGLYFILIGILFSVCEILFKFSYIAFIVTYLLANGLDGIISILRIYPLIRFSILSHSRMEFRVLLEGDYQMYNNVISIAYLLCISFILYFIGKKCVENLNYVSEK